MRNERVRHPWFESHRGKAMVRLARQNATRDATALVDAPLAANLLGLQHDVASLKRVVRTQFQRDLYIFVLDTFLGINVNTIARHLGINRKGISESLAAVKRKLETDEDTERYIDQIGARLTMQAELRQRIQADIPELTRLFPSGPTAVQLAFRYKISVAEAAPLISSFYDNQRNEWRGGEHKPTKDASLSRFGTSKPDGGVDLKVNHPAVIEGRTIFPSTVVSVRDTERLLVSGHNNPKLGAEVRKGPWKGFPIYHLTLEERATCPRSCPLWRGCYGNAMHMARRHDHRDADFLVSLEMELTALAGKHPFGFAVRLHTLGDFYSIEYVKFWEFMLDALPSLHVFGFTAYGPWAEDEREQAIGEALETLSHARWDRFAIRFSGWEGFQGSKVFDKTPPSPEESLGTALALPEHREKYTGPEYSKIVMCPAQTGATAACATCGLCWAESARNVTIGFLRHGMKGKRKSRVPNSSQKPMTWNEFHKAVQRVEVNAPSPKSSQERPNSVLHCSTETPVPAEKLTFKSTPEALPDIPFAEDRGVVRLTRKPAKLGISKEEQDALIAEALKSKTVTVCPPAFGGASVTQWRGVKK